MRRFLILTTALLLSGLLTACGDDSTGPSSIFGTYTLVSVNGEGLPWEPEPGFELIAGWIRLNSDSTYTVSLTADIGSGPVTETDTGTFTVTGSTIDLIEGLFATATATVSGNTLTIHVDSDTLVFRK
jgi:hypothetical protein